MTDRDKQAEATSATIHEIHSGQTSATRDAVAPNGSPRLLIDPMSNLILGSQNIRKYLGIRSIITLYEWHEIYSLPIMKRPDGQWMTTISAIDDWIWMASELEVKNRPYGRGDNKRAELALKKAQRRVDRLKSREAELGSREAAIRSAQSDLKDT